MAVELGVKGKVKQADRQLVKALLSSVVSFSDYNKNTSTFIEVFDFMFIVLSWGAVRSVVYCLL